MQGHVCVQLMLNFYGSWASFQNPMPLLKQTSLLFQHKVCIQSYQVPWVCFQRECFQTHYPVTRDSEHSFQSHIGLVSDGVKKNTWCIKLDLTLWQVLTIFFFFFFFFNVFDVKQSSALGFFPSPPLQLSPSKVSSRYTLSHSVWQ